MHTALVTGESGAYHAVMAEIATFFGTYYMVASRIVKAA